MAGGGGVTTSVIGQRLDDYVTLRRSLGFKFDETSRLLAGLVGYLDEIGSTTVTTEVLLAWTSRSAGSRGPDAAGRLLSAARGFARYLASFDPATEVPPARLLPARSRRAIPFIYSKAEIDALMAATSAIESKLLAASYRTLVGLLAATGIRVGEAVGLDRDDVDTDDEALLVVRDGKFGKSRQVPLHPLTTTALRDYAEVRDRYCRRPRSTAWFLSSAGTRLRRSNIWRNFNKLREIAGLQRRSATCRPGSMIFDIRSR